jgi:hypothetical protein
MSQIISAVRDVMSDISQMNINEILKKIQKGAYQMKLSKEELQDVLSHYKKLQVVYIDQDENVIFL